MNTLQTILHHFVTTYPQPDQPPQLDLTVGTHDPDRDTSKFRLSDAGRCRLMRYWKRQGKESVRTIPADVLLQMQAGNLLHAWIERACREEGWLRASEDRLEDEHRIGHFDLLLSPPDSTDTSLYDVKTISNKKSFYMGKNGHQPDPQHIFQLVSYALMLPDPADELCLAYVVRDTLDIREIAIDPAAYQDEVVSDWALLIRAWKAQEPPDPNPSSWECRYCAYHHTCGFAL